MLYLYLYFTREQVSGMKKWKILFNIIMETVIFFGIAVLLIIGLQTNHALFNQYGDDCIKIKVDAFNHMIGSKAVDCCER